MCMRKVVPNRAPWLRTGVRGVFLDTTPTRCTERHAGCDKDGTPELWRRDCGRQIIGTKSGNERGLKGDSPSDSCQTRLLSAARLGNKYGALSVLRHRVL